mgnify:CR=1 FL=1
MKEQKEIEKKKRQALLASQLPRNPSPPPQIVHVQAPPPPSFDYEKLSNMVVEKIRPKPVVSKQNLLQVENKIREDERRKLEAERLRQEQLKQKTFSYYSRLPPTDLTQPDYWKNMFGMQ